MKAKWAIAVSLLAAACAPAFAGTPSMCPRDAQHEGMRELRNREMGMACRVEMMSSMLEMMVRHEQAAQDQAGR